MITDFEGDMTMNAESRGILRERCKNETVVREMLSAEFEDGEREREPDNAGSP